MRLIAVQRNAVTLGQMIPEVPTLSDKPGLMLRARLILEEALETIEAMGLAVIPDEQGKLVVKDTGAKADLVAIVDGCFDLSVVNIGTLSHLGVPDSGLEIVDMNNLEKFAPGFKIREDGKLIKPPGHRPPDIKGWLETLK